MLLSEKGVCVTFFHRKFLAPAGPAPDHMTSKKFLTAHGQELTNRPDMAVSNSDTPLLYALLCFSF